MARKGRALTISVPPGTEITLEQFCDGGTAQGRRWELLATGQRATLARGGSGGRGNKRFATATRQAPRFAERGLVGEEAWLELRLKLLADVGLVGLPNAGKSSLLSRLTRAEPKVASYPFTTLSPVLGVLDGEQRQLVIADIPGLIEGASEGAGLGHDFLAHVERTRLLVHVLDIAPEISAGEGADAVLNHATVERELAAHDQRLAQLPRVLALSKADLVSRERALAAVADWERRLAGEVPVLAISSVTGEGIPRLRAELLQRFAALELHDAPVGAPASTRAAPMAAGVELAPGGAGAGAGARPGGEGAPGEQELAEHMVFRPLAGAGFEVERVRPGAFAVRGRGIERLLARFDAENEEAMAYVEGRLRRDRRARRARGAGVQGGGRDRDRGCQLRARPERGHLAPASTLRGL